MQNNKLLELQKNIDCGKKILMSVWNQRSASLSLFGTISPMNTPQINSINS